MKVKVGDADALVERLYRLHRQMERAIEKSPYQDSLYSILLRKELKILEREKNLTITHKDLENKSLRCTKCEESYPIKDFIYQRRRDNVCIHCHKANGKKIKKLWRKKQQIRRLEEKLALLRKEVAQQ